MGKRGPKPIKTDLIYKKRSEIEMLKRRGLTWWKIYIELFTTVVEKEKPSFKTFKTEVFKWKKEKPSKTIPHIKNKNKSEKINKITRKNTNFF